MLSIIILSFSSLIQFLAAFFALFTIKITRKKTAWILIFIVIIFMGARRLIPLYNLLLDKNYQVDIVNEAIGLVLSILLLAGIILVRDIFNEWDIHAKKIEALYNEKATLLKEVHHRIKNNIYSIEGFLGLQAASITGTEARAALKDAVTRTKSMRIIYDKLLLSDDYTETSVKNYLEDLIPAITAIFPENDAIAVNIKIDDFNLNVKKLFPLGIIVNELITNSMKYALTSLDSGRLDIELSNTGKEVTLSVQDNGPGLPEGFDPDNSTGFGIKLIKILSGQLDAELKIENNNGVRSTIKFNI